MQVDNGGAYTTLLTCVDEILVGDARVIDVMYSTRQDYSQNFHVREHVLSNNADLTRLTAIFQDNPDKPHSGFYWC